MTHITPQSPVNIVLVGGGHSHVEVMRRHGLERPHNRRITLIAAAALTPYSGMLPGYIAGHYGADDIHIDLPRLADWAGIRFIEDRVVAIDRDRCAVRCASGREYPYDLLSLNIGATPRSDEHAPDSAVVAVKPIGRFRKHWLDLLQRACTRQEPTTIAVVGAGAAGVELVLALQHRLNQEMQARRQPSARFQFHLFSRSPQILPTHGPRLQALLMAQLSARGVKVHLGAEVRRVRDGHLEAHNAPSLEVDDVIWVTDADGPAWLRDTGLALDPCGFVRVGNSLQSISDARIFAAGDVASVQDHALEKAGVFAVRQGPILAENLRRAALGKPLRDYRPQHRRLALITTGDHYAVASWGSIAFGGRWVWRWKDWIDRRFMARYDRLPEAASGDTA